VKWRRIEQLAPSTTALTELTGAAAFMFGRNSSAPTFADVVATVSKYGQYYIVTEEVDLYNPNGTTNELVATLGEAAGRSLNQLMRNVGEGNFTQVYANNVASLGAVIASIAAGDINYAVNKLTVNVARVFPGMTPGSTNIGTVPILPSYWGLTHPDVAYDISQLTGFVNVAQYAQQTQIMEGEFGYFPMAGRGVRFIMSEDAGVSLGAGAASSGHHQTTAKADVYNTLVYGQDALGSVGLGMKHADGIYKAGDNTGSWDIINHPPGSGGIGDPFNEIGTIAWKAFFAGAVLNANWGLDIRSAATLLVP
jgi:N4-gp56 family major capsid protein